MTDAIRIELPVPRPEGLEAFVARELNISVEVEGSSRGLIESASDLAPVVIFVTESFVATVIGNRGEKALAALVTRLRRQGVPATGSPEAGRPVEVVEEQERRVTWVFNQGIRDDPEAVRQMLEVDRTALPRGARLLWDPVERQWLVGLEPDELADD